MTTPIKIVGLPGSLRTGSYTREAVTIALQGAAESGAETRLLDLLEYNLPFADGKKSGNNYPPGVFRLREDIAGAQGIIFGTPEYHGGMSGVLKNALDLMGFSEFEGKMIGLVGVSGGMMGATNALSSLRAIGRALHAWVIPEQVSIPQGWNKFGEDGILKDEALRERLMEVGRQVTHFASLHDADKDPDFLNLWQTAPVNPGGGGP